MLSDWLEENSFSPNFKPLPIEELAELPRKFYRTELSKKGKQSGWIGLINRPTAQENDWSHEWPNRVFTGHLRDNKEKGLDVSKKRLAIDQEDIEKMFKNYFTPAMKMANEKVLIQKVFFDIIYYTGTGSKERT